MIHAKQRTNRPKLQRIEDQRKTFTGEFARMGTKPGYKGPPKPTVLLNNIRDQQGNIMSDHLWFNYTKAFQSLTPITPGDVIQFDARVKSYQKGHYTELQTTSYKLSHPSKVSKQTEVQTI